MKTLPKYVCGNYGCFEAMASEHALVLSFIKVVIGGGITRAKDLIEDRMMETVRQRALESCYKSVKIVFSQLGMRRSLRAPPIWYLEKQYEEGIFYDIF